MTDRQTKCTDFEIESALLICAGSVAQAAALLGMSRQGLHYRLKLNPRLREKADNHVAELIELCKAAIAQGVEVGHGLTTRWFLDHYGRDRGYGRRRHSLAEVPNDASERTVRALGGDVNLYRANLAALRRRRYCG